MKKLLFSVITTIIFSVTFCSCNSTTANNSDNDTLIHYFYTYNIADYKINGNYEIMFDSVKTDTLYEWKNENGNYQTRLGFGKYKYMEPVKYDDFVNELRDKYNIKNDSDEFPEYQNIEVIKFNWENNILNNLCSGGGYKHLKK